METAWPTISSIIVLVAGSINLFVALRNSQNKEKIMKEVRKIIEEETEDKLTRREFDNEKDHLWRAINKK